MQVTFIARPDLVPDVFELRNRKLEVCLVSSTGDADTVWKRTVLLANKDTITLWKNILGESREFPYFCWTINKASHGEIYLVPLKLDLQHRLAHIL
jgi:hypothetical protein